MFFCSRSYAQISEDADVYTDRIRVISVGGVIGANFCQVDGDAYAGYYKKGLNIGGIGYVRVYRSMAVSFELLYTQKGAKDNGARFLPTDSATLLVKYNINAPYVEIPVMFNYFDKHKSHFGVGAAYSRALNIVEKADTYPANMVDVTKYPFKMSEYSLLASAQMHVWKGLFFNVRFQYGLSPMRTVSPPEVARAQKQYNNLWTVRVMYIFL
ncbi:hypothetical protein GCM10023093_30870 [Nemorincola caseinilytica]|uniref:Outer membrane protein beta-barrel domain-containing protein n=1 Tax=Nemorincola caseinilytica TaxID=2054315 RepID=A0ABP8NP95_9BACT